MTLFKQSIPYFVDSQGILTDVKYNSSMRDTAIKVGYYSTSIPVRHVLVSFSLSYTKHHNSCLLVNLV